MPTRRATTHEAVETPVKRGRPASTPAAREQELVSLAYDVVESRLRKGTASSQETTHFLKMGSMREAIEQERIRGEVALNEAKIQNMAQQQKIEDLMKEALAAMQSYSMTEPANRHEEFDD